MKRITLTSDSSLLYRRGYLEMFPCHLYQLNSLVISLKIQVIKTTNIPEIKRNNKWQRKLTPYFILMGITYLTSISTPGGFLSTRRVSCERTGDESVIFVFWLSNLMAKNQKYKNKKIHKYMHTWIHWY